jgi:hypothetical protein
MLENSNMVTADYGATPSFATIITIGKIRAIVYDVTTMNKQ